LTWLASIIALREESGVVVWDVEVLAEENVSKTGLSFLLLLMSLTIGHSYESPVFPQTFFIQENNGNEKCLILIRCSVAATQGFQNFSINILLQS